MKSREKIFAFLLVFLLLFQSCGTNPKDLMEATSAETYLPTVKLDISTSAESAVLIDASEGGGRILWEQNAHQRRPMASTTKIMTALVAAESLPLSTKVVIPKEAVGVEGSSVYLAEGEVLTLEELLYCLLLQSANDAAVAIAYAVSGSVSDFAKLMNEKARQLGLSDTQFKNPHGLDEDGHYTTAYELGIIASKALGNEKIRQIFSTYRATVSGRDGTSRHLINHNRLLNSYDGCLGMKTGYTQSSGRCLVSAAERDGLVLIAVTLSAHNDWRDHTALLDAGFANFRRVCLGDGENILSPKLTLPSIKLSGSIQSTLRTALLSPVWVTLPVGTDGIECSIESERLLFAPQKRGNCVGTVRWTIGDTIIAEEKLVVAYSAARRAKNRFWG